MTGRERVRRCLEWDRPDRVPRELWMLPGSVMEHGQAAVDELLQQWPGDFTQCREGRATPRLVQGDPYLPGQSRDEWGCVFENILPGVHGEVKDPLLADWAGLEDLQPPGELLEVDVAAVNTFCREHDDFVFASGWARPFERMQFLRGTQDLLMDLMDEPPELQVLFDVVHGFFRDQYQLWARTEVDALVMMDDWGGQKAMLLSPNRWRERFKPLYAEYVQIAHDAGKKFFMHSDGWIFDIYEDLIEIGVDAINSQLFCMDIEEIGRRFRGRITFWGEIDRQHILPRGTSEEVQKAVTRVVENLWDPKGGAIAQFSLTPGDGLANAYRIYETWDVLTSPPG